MIIMFSHLTLEGKLLKLGSQPQSVLAFGGRTSLVIAPRQWYHQMVGRPLYLEIE